MLNLALAVVLAGAAYVSRISDELGSTWRERDEAKADAAGKARAIAARRPCPETRM